MSRLESNLRRRNGDDSHGHTHFPSVECDVVDRAPGYRFDLAGRNRLNPALVSERDILIVQDGTLALETMPTGGRRQILDFLVAGDALLVSASISHGAVFLRAVNNVSLERRLDGAVYSAVEIQALIQKLDANLTRRNFLQIMIGQLDVEPRAATFLLSLALRSEALEGGRQLDLPMSRDDIADYLAMNPDTLSRIMMRLETLGLIRRLTRHAIMLVDIQGLADRTPLRQQLLSIMCGGQARALST